MSGSSQKIQSPGFQNTADNNQNQTSQSFGQNKSVATSHQDEADAKFKSSQNDENEDDQLFDDEFHDAVEDVTQFSVTLPRQKTGLHHRNPSNISKLYLQESDVSSDEEDQQTIKVTMHTNKDASNEPVKQHVTQLSKNTSASNVVANLSKKSLHKRFKFAQEFKSICETKTHADTTTAKLQH